MNHARLHLHRLRHAISPRAKIRPRNASICEEERQYVPPRGQTWTTLEALRQSHMNGFREYEPGIIGIGTQPAFAIGQRALLVRTPGGNVLWDCIAHARRRDGRADQGPRRHAGDRDLAPAFLHHDGGMGARLRRADPSARRRQGLDHAAGSGDPAMGGRNARTLGRRHARSAAAAISKAARCCIGRAARAAAARSAAATS